ncbi:MAG: class I SAM-dependent methyltransferase [Rhodocyclales bacterium]|nr:class I SAM-dependent methyltransferase [Rhodocyclales bacterium]
MTKPTLQCPCDARHLQAAFHYDAPPPGETSFDCAGQKYQRAYSRCGLCGHWFSDNAMDMSELYGGAYVDNTYGERMRETFDRIQALPPETSDNAGRVACILDFSHRHFGPDQRRRLLDVGAGLGVFPHRMKEAGWQCTALDPDERASRHAREVVGVDAVTGDFMKVDIPALGKFDVVTFNKVLEHVEDPVAMLARAKPLIEDGGFVYFEVPDGEAAAVEGSGREEFFIEHHHVFSAASAVLLAKRAGFRPMLVQSLREPSSKFTIRCFVGLSHP